MEKAKWLRKAVFSNVIEKDQNYFEVSEKENNERKKLKTMCIHMGVSKLGVHIEQKLHT